jgi:hypothetical protein
MTRHVTVTTVDQGAVSLPEPAWCLGHDGQQPGFLVDIDHRGPELRLGTDEHPVFVAQLSQHPHGGGSHAPGLYVEQVDFARTLGPDEADRLAAALIEAAVQLRSLARRVAVLRAGGAR